MYGHKTSHVSAQYLTVPEIGLMFLSHIQFKRSEIP